MAGGTQGAGLHCSWRETVRAELQSYVLEQVVFSLVSSGSTWAAHSPHLHRTKSWPVGSPSQSSSCILNSKDTPSFLLRAFCYLTFLEVVFITALAGICKVVNHWTRLERFRGHSYGGKPLTLQIQGKLGCYFLTHILLCLETVLKALLHPDHFLYSFFIFLPSVYLSDIEHLDWLCKLL